MTKSIKEIEAEFREFQRSLRVRSWQTNRDARTYLQEDEREPGQETAGDAAALPVAAIETDRW